MLYRLKKAMNGCVCTIKEALKIMENNICLNWFEDDYGYGSKELCKGNNNKLCTCSGVKEQCNYPEYFTNKKEANKCGI